MALMFADRVKETSTTTGTGTLSLGGTVTGYQTFVNGIGDGNTCPYLIDDGNGNWELTYGVIASGTPATLTRGTLINSSTGSRISFLAGTKTVAIVMAAELTLLAVPATIRRLTSGSGATYTPTSSRVRIIRVTIKGGGGGSAGNGTSGATSGGTGGTTSFNGVTAIGGSPSTISSNGVGGTGGGGGSDNGLTVNRMQGASGGNAGVQVWTATTFVGTGGIGGGKGAAAASISGTANPGVAAAANSGGGGSGPSIGSVNQATHDTYVWSAGGGEGEEATVCLPATTYTFTVGAGGAAGSSGTAGAAGATGGAGLIVVEEFS